MTEKAFAFAPDPMLQAPLRERDAGQLTCSGRQGLDLILRY